ncbi:MAG: ABC transporter permease, partial [Bdellovibrionota bacterium]
STFLGTGLGIALQGGPPFRGKKWLETLVHVPILMPEIVMGLSLLVWFVFLKITLGTGSIILAHVTFGMSYVVLTVRTRLEGFDRSLEEAARDLGATPFQAFFQVVLPWIAPGILSGALMAFTLSFDDFLIAFFVSGAGADTLPLKIYAMIKFGVSREVNAVSTWMLALTLAAVLVIFGPLAKISRRGRHS